MSLRTSRMPQPRGRLLTNFGAPLVLLAFLLLFQFELVLGLWLLVKGVRTDRESAARS